MVTVEKARREMFEDVYELLQDFNARNLTKSDWNYIFNHNWDGEEDNCGYVLVDNGKIVGFLGAIYSKRLLNGKIENFCNLTSWIVKENYRNKSISLLFPILKLTDYTITNFTASKEVGVILKKFGFKELDNKVKVLPLSPYLGNVFVKSHFSVTTERGIISKRLSNNDLKIFNAHLPYKCDHLLIYNTDRYSYVVYTKRKMKRVISFNHIHYISNQEIFLKNISQSKLKLFKENKFLLTVVDARLLEGKNVPFSIDCKPLLQRLYRSSVLKREQIDNLYSEFILLNR